MKKMLTQQEVADIIGVSVGTLENWRAGKRVKEGRSPPFYKLGHVVRYDADELQMWVDSQKALTDPM